MAEDLTIRITQYLLPDGRKRSVLIDRPKEIVEKARTLVRQGYHFECEMLNDYETVSLTIVDDSSDRGDVAIELAKNGPDVPVAVDRLIMNFKP